MLKMLKLFRLPLTLITCTALLLGCSEKPHKGVEAEALPLPWWEPLEPDLIIANDEFYAGVCSITRVSNILGVKTPNIIFKVPKRLLTTCSNRGPLEYDGDYLILSVCEMSFAAGGCGGGRYRSADLKQWEEHIGVSWIDGEEYEAWRKVGSTSAKADSVKKVVRE